MALLATLAQADEPLEQPSRWRWPRLIGWAVPVATAATAAALWVYVGQEAAPPPPVPQQTVPAAPRDAPLRGAQPTASVPPSEGQRAVQRQQEPRLFKDSAPSQAPARDDQKTRAELDRAAPRSSDAREKRVAVRAEAPPAAAPAAPAPPPLAETVVSGAASDTSRFAGAALRSVVGAIQIASPDRTVVWRVSGTTVQRSADGGLTWTAEPTPATTPLRAGSAPSSSVCWIVGASGTVLLWVEGQGWRQVAFPEPVDLTAVRATGERDAEVTAADGRRFRTSDGGKTWVIR
jgi:hypothetical protein